MLFMENHYNCIYMYTNKINGKGYVGKAEDFLIRKQQHIYRSYNKKCKDYNVPFHRAIRKYGIESLEVTILKENLTEDEMNYWEDYYIETFDLYAKNGKGYNVAKGGRGGNTFAGKTEKEMEEIFNDEWKQKQSEAKKGKNHPMYGKHLSEETKQKMSENHADVSGKNHPMYGKHLSEETKNKISEANKGKNNPKAKRVAQYDKQGNLIRIWDYAKKASEELCIAHSNIIQCCKGKLKSAGGYIWRYAEQTE